MAKAEASGDRFIERASATGAKLRDYGGALGVAATGVLGFGLLCILAGIAMADPSVSAPAAIAPMDLVDSAFSNLSTVSAPTFEAISRLIATPTILPTDTAASTPTLTLSRTPVVFPTFAFIQPTNTRRPRSGSLPTRIPPTDIPPTDIPPTDIPPTDIPPTDIPPTDVPPPPTDVPPPPTDVPPPPTGVPQLPIVPTPMP